MSEQTEHPRGYNLLIALKSDSPSARRWIKITPNPLSIPEVDALVLRMETFLTSRGTPDSRVYRMEHS